MGLWRIVVLAFIALINLCITAVAQPDKFHFNEINGINSNEVIKGIVKDSVGNIWLATDHGILKYDGVETKFINQGLSSHYTKKFEITRDGRLLVISDSGVQEIINYKDSIVVKPFQLGEFIFNEPLNYPKSIFEDSRGRIWIGEVDAVVLLSDKGLKRYHLGKKYQSISYHRTFAFAEDAFGHIWIAPYKGSLLSYDEQKNAVLPIKANQPITEVNAIEVVKGDHLLLGGRQGLWKIKIDSDKQILREELLNQINNISTLASVNDKIFFGTWDKGLYSFTFDESPTNVEIVKDVTFNDILDFHFDLNRNELWLTGSENIGLLNQSVVSEVNDQLKYRVESVTSDKNKVYVSTGDQILRMEDTSLPEVILDAFNNYFDCIQLEASDLWIGDSFGAIYKYDLENKTQVTVKDSTGHAVKYIFKDSYGNKWFAGDPVKLVQIDATGKRIDHLQVKTSNVIRQSPSGNIYAGGYGTGSILYKYDSVKGAFITLDLEFNSSVATISIEDIAFSPEGNVWIATNNGLYSLSKDEKELQKLEIPGLNINEPFKAIAFYDGVLWIGSSHGLTAYNNEDAVLFTHKNGLPSKILKERGINVHDGELLIATAKGLAQINHEVEVFKETPTPIFKKILVNGQSLYVNSKDKIILPYNSRIQAEYLSLVYPGGDNVVYKSRVVGLDKSWSPPSSNRILSFLGFSEGDYSLEVAAMDEGYLWSQPATIHMTVEQPWFKRWWAYILFGIFAATVIGLSIRVYNYSLILQKRKLKKIIELRTKEINIQKNKIIEQKNHIIKQKEELIEKNNAVHKTQQALSEADVNFLHLKEKQLHDQIEYRNKQITTYTLNIIQKNETLKELQSKLEKLTKTADKDSQAELKKTLKVIDHSFKLDKDWEDFKLFFEQVYTGFYTKLKVSCPALTTQELRHCALIRLNLSLAECASILGISPDSIKVSRARIRKKLDLEPGQGLTDFILSI